MVANPYEDHTRRTGRENREVLICQQCGRVSDIYDCPRGAGVVVCDQCGRVPHYTVRWERGQEDDAALAAIADAVAKGRWKIKDALADAVWRRRVPGDGR